MLIGGDDISNDIIALAHVFQWCFTFKLVSALCWLAEIWQLSRGEPQGSGGGIQIPETELQALLPFPTSWRGAMGELARELDFFG